MHFVFLQKAEKIRERRLYYDHQLENLKQTKSTSDQVEFHFILFI